MIRSIVTAARPSLVCLQTRTYRAKPVYYNPADPDFQADQKFNEEFGLAEPEEDTWGVSKHEPFAWFFDPYIKARARLGKFFGADLYYKQSPEEVAERAELTDRLHQFYSTIPQSYPDAQWWNDVIDHYVRFNDFDGAQRLWFWLKEYELDIDQSILDKFARLFYENDPVGLTQKSLPQQLREQQEYIPDKPPDNWFRVGEYGIEPE